MHITKMSSRVRMPAVGEEKEAKGNKIIKRKKKKEVVSCMIL